MVGGQKHWNAWMERMYVAKWWWEREGSDLDNHSRQQSLQHPFTAFNAIMAISSNEKKSDCVRELKRIDSLNFRHYLTRILHGCVLQACLSVCRSVCMFRSSDYHTYSPHSRCRRQKNGSHWLIQPNNWTWNTVSLELWLSHEKIRIDRHYSI